MLDNLTVALIALVLSTLLLVIVSLIMRKDEYLDLKAEVESQFDLLRMHINEQTEEIHDAIIDHEYESNKDHAAIKRRHADEERDDQKKKRQERGAKKREN